MLKNNLYVTLGRNRSEIHSQYFEEGRTHCEDLRPPPQFLRPAFALPGTPVTYPSLWVMHPSMWWWRS